MSESKHIDEELSESKLSTNSDTGDELKEENKEMNASLDNRPVDKASNHYAWNKATKDREAELASLGVVAGNFRDSLAYLCSLL